MAWTSTSPIPTEKMFLSPPRKVLSLSDSQYQVVNSKKENEWKNRTVGFLPLLLSSTNP